VIKLAAQALLRHSAANVRRDGASAVRPSSVDIGIAVETDRGLIVPVVRGVEAKSLRQIAGESAGLAERARSGALADGEIGGETIAVVDLGAFELDEFAPVGARFDGMVLAVGRVVARQVVTEAAAGRTAIRRMMRLSLAFDARLVDPAPAARLLQTVKRFVEQPLAWLIDA
jgi:pyruvate/2-oxoglutarate dehydrogenase complex dihydrolipoamide acyltransferase (E2) component